MKQISIFFIFLVLYFLSLTYSQASEFLDVASTLQEEILTKIVGHVESQNSNASPDVISRGNLSKVSKKFFRLVRKNDDEFYHLSALGKIDNLEQKAINFISIFGTLIDTLKQATSNATIYCLINRFQPSNKDFFYNFTNDSLAIQTMVQKMKQVFQNRPLHFPAIDCEYNEILKSMFPKKLNIQQIRGLNLLQGEVQKFIKEMGEILENAQGIITMYSNDAENFYVYLWRGRYQHLRTEINNFYRYYQLSKQKINKKLEQPGLREQKRASLVQRQRIIDERYAYIQKYADSWSTIAHEVHDLKTFEDVMRFHHKADKILPKFDPTTANFLSI